ncbi:MAG TPA: ABC transporter permease [Longimicrobiales bacterium]|nr:ABC transporter permease [Longimicrobiales bacterium]
MIRSLKLRLRRLFAPAAVDHELDEEMRFHIESTERELVEAGHTPAEAHRLARLEFGSVDRFSEEHRDAGGVRLLDDLRHDVRFAVRSLARTPAFTAASLVTLALGIGATTAMFSVVDTVLLRPLPYAAPETLVRVWQADRTSGTEREASAVPDYFDYRDRTRTLSGLAAHAVRPRSITRDGGAPERVTVLATTHTLFDVLGTRLITGNAFTAADDVPGAPGVVVLSERLWRTRFDADPAIVGAPVRLDDSTYTVVGVAAAGQEYPHEQVDLWEPLRMNASSMPRYTHVVDVTARLADGVSVAAAQADITRIMAELEAEYPENAGRGGSVEPLEDVVLGRMRAPLMVLLGGVALLLVIACANVANLLLARGAGRAREIAVRTSLGAGSGRLARQFIAETLTLTLAAGVLATGLAWLGVRALDRLVPADLPRFSAVTVDLRVLAVTASFCIVTALLFGMLPLGQVRRTDPADALRGRGVSAGTSRLRLRRVLVAAQVALSMTLLIGAGLLLRSFQALSGVDPGFRAEQVLKVEYELPESRYPRDFANYPQWPEVQRFNRDLLARAATVPGVDAVGIAAYHPLAPGSTNSFVIVGRESEAADQAEIGVRPISPGYLDAVGVRLLSGRAFDARDDASSPAVLLINETAVRLHFPDADPIGQRIRFWGADREIVGVVADERYAGLASDAPAAIYPPVTQTPMLTGALLVRTSLPPMSLAPAMQRIISSLDPGLAVFQVEPLGTTLASSIARERFTATLFAAFAMAALLLALTGVHGLVAYLLALRTHEVGIRAALGAAPAELRMLFMREGLLLTTAGVAAGIVTGLLGSRLLGSLLFGITPTDARTYAVAIALMLAITLVAAWLPARRAGRVSPLSVLRSD